MEFLDYAETWALMTRLEFEGVDVQRSVLEKGWTAYMQVPETLKREIRLVNGEGLSNVVNVRSSAGRLIRFLYHKHCIP